MATASPLPAFNAVEYQTNNAFHGTKLADAQAIFAAKKFNPPNLKNDCRFGAGYYFWENTISTALKWAAIFYRGQQLAIIRAQLDCKKLLDLLTAEHYHALEQIRGVIARDRGIRPQDLRHATVLSILSTAKLIDSTRLIAATSPQTTIHQDSKLAGPFDVMLCIYDPVNILVTNIQEPTR